MKYQVTVIPRFEGFNISVYYYTVKGAFAKTRLKLFCKFAYPRKRVIISKMKSSPL